MSSDHTSAPEHENVGRENLAVPDYDHLPLESLAQRIRSLDAGQLDDLLAYERAHANRLPAVQVLEQRAAALREGAEPSGGDPAGLAPEQAPAPSGGSPVSPETSGPAMNPPSQGVPTNPAQPRSTG